MPQKKSSQLYSVSPKSFLRMPKKRRKGKRTTVIFSVVGVLLLIFLVGAGGYMYLTNSVVLSPLPAQLGGLLPTSSSDQSEKELKSLLRSHNIMYTAISRSSDEFVITLNLKQRVFVTRDKNLTEQISSLQDILPHLTMEGKQFRQLDLRYDKPVVTY